MIQADNSGFFYSQILSEASIDNYFFQVTPSPFEKGSCILWFRDIRSTRGFTALGKFSSFNRKKILSFIVEYASSPELRVEVETRKFERKTESMKLEHLRIIELMSRSDREKAFKNLYNLDDLQHISLHHLSRRRKMMTKRFHPDLAGGDNKAMELINEAYDFLSKHAVKQ